MDSDRHCLHTQTHGLTQALSAQKNTLAHTGTVQDTQTHGLTQVLSAHTNTGITQVLSANTNNAALTLSL